MVNIRKKILFSILMILSLSFIFNPMIVKAEKNRVFDEAKLFSSEEINILNDNTKNISNDYDMDIVILTIDNAKGKTSREYADDYFDYNSFGIGENLDGILFLIDMDNRETYISKSGKGNDYLTDKRTENVIQSVLDGGLSDGDYYNATQKFLKGTEEYLDKGIPVDQDSGNSLTFLEIILSLFVGAIVAVLFYFGIKSRYKMKNPVKILNFRENSTVDLTKSEDTLIDTILTHRTIPKPSNNDSSNSGTHTSSSGNSHGGSGSKF